MLPNQRGFSQILILILLVIGVAVAVYLTQTKQLDFSHADSGTPAAAAACDPSKVTMSIAPTTAKVGDSVTLNMTNVDGEGTTYIGNNGGDQLVGLSECVDNIGVGTGKFGDANLWPTVPKYKTCKVSAVPYKWIHQWKNCAPNDASCSAGNSCSRYFDSATGLQPATPLPAAAKTTTTSTTTTATTPVTTTNTTTTPASTNITADQIKTTYGITVNGFDQQHLNWIGQRFNELSSYNFINLVKGATINSGSQNGQEGTCAAPITVIPSSQEAFFKFSLLHELSHKLQNCQVDAVDKTTLQLQALDKEGPVSSYAKCAVNPIIGPVNVRVEDYADMLAYYLSPSVQEFEVQPGCDINGGQNPYANGKHPEHYAVAKQIVGGGK